MYFLKRRINLFNDWKNTRVIPCDPTSSRMSGGWLQYSVECWLQCQSGIALCAIPPGQEARAARISQNCWWRLGHVEIREDLIENSGHHPRTTWGRRCIKIAGLLLGHQPFVTARSLGKTNSICLEEVGMRGSLNYMPCGPTTMHNPIKFSHWDGGCSTGRVAFGHLEALGSNRDIQRAVHAAQRFLKPPTETNLGSWNVMVRRLLTGWTSQRLSLPPPRMLARHHKQGMPESGTEPL